MPEPLAPDPPGFYMGWPLASLLKRCMSGVLDYGVFFFVAVVIASLMAAVVRAIAGENAGAAASLLLVGAAYCASLYNFSVLQSRTGQTWGKGIVGVRAVDIVQLTPPGKLILGFKPFFSVMEIIFGVGLVAIMFSRYRQSISDRFCGIVVIDERKADLTLPWVLPGQPVMELAPPQPQGGVPRPERTRRLRRPRPDTATVDEQPMDPFSDPDEHPVLTPEPDDDVDLPEVEFSEEPLRPPADEPAAPDDDDFPEPEVEDPIRPQAATAETAVRDDDPFPEPDVEDPIRRRVVPEPPFADSGPASAPDDDRPPRDDLPPLATMRPRPAPAPTPSWHDSGHPDGAVDESPPQTVGHESVPDEGHYLTHASIAEAIRADKMDLANELARDAIEAYFDLELMVDIPQAVAEYRALFRKNGKAIRADDATVARWLGLS
jgi:uncharacterized RDD family membrane protein YckC